VKREPNRPLPEIFVETEDNVRFRKEIPQSTPYYNETPDKKELMGREREDSGFTETSETSSRYEDLSHLSARTSLEDTTTLWDRVTSPILDLKSQLQGKARQSFVEERPKIKIKNVLNVDTLVTGGLMVVLVSSILCSVFIGFNPQAPLNGKMKSIQFGSERRNLALKRENRLIDYDIKDSEGNILGGKRAAIQFAFDLRQATEAEDFLKKVAPSVKELPVQVAKAEVSEPEPLPKDAKSNQQLSIADLSQKIEEISAVLQGSNELTEEEVDLLESELDLLKLRKKNLIVKKLKATKNGGKSSGKRQAKAKNKATPAPVVFEDLEVPEGELDSEFAEEVSAPAPVAQKKLPRQPKTKAENPLTKSAQEQNKQSKAKSKASSSAGSDYPDDPQFRSGGSLSDHPDDPQFRSGGSTDHPDDPQFRSGGQSGNPDDPKFRNKPDVIKK